MIGSQHLQKRSDFLPSGEKTQVKGEEGVEAGRKFGIVIAA